MQNKSFHGVSRNNPTVLPLSSDTESQQQRILNHLRNVGPLTTTDARKVLDVLMPATRIFELREAGHNIVTHWKTVDTGKGRHRVAEYVLMPEGV